MESFLNKRILVIYWIVLLVHCVFQFYVSPYRVITKPMLVPLLLTFLLLHDSNIGKPTGKLIFYIGLFLAFFGDVLLILINDTFFLSGMIAFMLMNLFYSISFLCLNPIRVRSLPVFGITMAALLALGFLIYDFLYAEMGDYRLPVMIYLFSLALMVAFALNLALHAAYRAAALRYFIPGALIFMGENILVAFNLFHWGKDKNLYIIIMLTYGIAQYLLVSGIPKVYPSPGMEPDEI